MYNHVYRFACRFHVSCMAWTRMVFVSEEKHYASGNLAKVSTFVTFLKCGFNQKGTVVSDLDRDAEGI